jgi:RNA 3'-terminal phosphate cyclase (ATP)
MGISVDATLEKWGFYPKGGGRIQFDLKPVHALKPINLTDRGSLKKIQGLSTQSHLPRQVAERQSDQARKRIQNELNMNAEINILYDVPSNGPGSFLFLLAEYEKTVAGFSSLGSRGKPAEKVADEAVESLKNYIESEGCIDPHLADQLTPFMALTKGSSSFTTNQITEHLLTNLWVIGHFLQVKVRKRGEIGKAGGVEFLNE